MHNTLLSIFYGIALFDNYTLNVTRKFQLIIKATIIVYTWNGQTQSQWNVCLPEYCLCWVFLTWKEGKQ